MRRLILLPLVGCAGLFASRGPDRSGPRRSAADADAADAAYGHSPAASAIAASAATATSPLPPPRRCHRLRRRRRCRHLRRWFPSASATCAASGASASRPHSAAGDRSTASGHVADKRCRALLREPRRAPGQRLRSALARSVRVTRTRFSTHGPAARRGTVISFRLSRPGKVLLVVRSAAGSCEVLGRRRVAGASGLNRVRFRGRVHGRPLAPGRYLIDVVVVRGKSPKRVGRVTVEIVRPGTASDESAACRACRGACAVSAGSASLPAAVVDPRSGDGRSGGDRRGRAPPRRPAAYSAAACSVRSSSAEASGPGWGRRAEAAVSPGSGWASTSSSSAAFLTMLVYVARFLRGSWNP